MKALPSPKEVERRLSETESARRKAALERLQEACVKVVYGPEPFEVFIVPVKSEFIEEDFVKLRAWLDWSGWDIEVVDDPSEPFLRCCLKQQGSK